MPLNTKYAPANILQYGSKDLGSNHIGVKFTATPAGQAIADVLISEDHLLDGARLVVIGAILGDKMSFQVIDKDNVMGFGANVVLGQYITDWYMNPNASEQFSMDSRYPAKVFGGLYLRIIYDAEAGGSDRSVICNFKLHKVLW